METYYIEAVEAWKASRGKPRGEWKLGELSNEQLSEVLRKLLNQDSHKSVRDFIEKDFKVVISSDRSLSEFYSGVKHFLGPARRNSVMRGARTTGPLSKEEQLEIDASNLSTLKLVCQEKLANPEIPPDELALVINAILKLLGYAATDKDINIKLRRLETLEAKEKRAEEAKEKLTALTNKGGMTKETIREIQEAAGLL